jgi:hypothetical protein
MTEPRNPSDSRESPDIPQDPDAPSRPDVDRRDRRNTFGTDTDPDTADDRPDMGDEDEDVDLEEAPGPHSDDVTRGKLDAR